MTAQEVLLAFEKAYGPREGRRRYMAVMPGVMADFTACLSKAPGGTLREEYRLDDGKGILILEGVKRSSGPEITVTFTACPG